MKQCQQAQVIGIASRSAQAAESAAKQLELPKHYASYEAALQDLDVDVIYNALPNHLQWSGAFAPCRRENMFFAKNPFRSRSKVAVG